MSDEIEDIRKRLQAVEKAIDELHIANLTILKIMAGESCTTHYNMYLPLQKGEEIEKYAKLWRERLKDAHQEIEKAKTIDDVLKAHDKFVNDIIDYVKAAKVDTAD